MSLLYFDGFDGYDSVADLTNFGPWYNLSMTTAPSSTVRTGSGKSQPITTGVTRHLAYNFSSDQIANTVYVGFAFYVSAANSDTDKSIVMFCAGANAGGNRHCYLTYSGATKLLSLYGPTGNLLATGTATINSGEWKYIEVKVSVADAGGVIECKVEGVLDAAYTGDTQNVTATFLSVSFEGGLTTIWHIDDVYILNSVGTANNTYLGEQRCEIMTPTADSTVAWARNTGASNFSAVDDAIGAPDDDTTYVSSSTSAQKDEYGLSDLTVISTVAGVKLVTRAEKDDVNPLDLKTGIKSGATDQQITHTLGVGYANFIDLFETSDGAGTAFTPTTVNSLLSTIEIP